MPTALRWIPLYSYNLGSLRQDFNSASNGYSGWAAAAFHRFGVNDALTVGLSGEASADGANLGPQATMRVKDLGVIAARLSLSYGRDGGGWAGQLGYGYQASGFSVGTWVRGFSQGYALAGIEPGAERPGSMPASGSAMAINALAISA